MNIVEYAEQTLNIKLSNHEKELLRFIEKYPNHCVIGGHSHSKRIIQSIWNQYNSRMEMVGQ